MGLAITPQLIQAAFWSFDTLYQQVYEDTPVHWPEFASELPSDDEQEVHAWLKRIPELREWSGERRLNELSASAYAIPNQTFEDSIKIKRTKFEDDKLGVFAQGIRELAFATKIWPDRLMATTLQSGVSYLASDGQPIFSTSHPVNPDNPTSATQSNNFVSTALNFQNFSTVRAAGESLLAENGVPFELEFDTLIVPPQLKTTALQLANAEIIAPTATFGAETTQAQTNVLKGSIKPVVFPRLANDPNTWYLACTNRAIRPLIFQNRLAAEFAYLNKPDDPNVFLRDEYIFGVRTRGAGAFGPWWLILRGTANGS